MVKLLPENYRILLTPAKKKEPSMLSQSCCRALGASLRVLILTAGAVVMLGAPSVAADDAAAAAGVRVRAANG